MIIEQFVLSAFQQNTRVVGCQTNKQVICIDPGDTAPEIVSYIKDNELTLQATALTHGHLDHVGGVGYLSGAFPDAEIILHADDEDLYYGLPMQPRFMGLQDVQLKALGMDYDAPPALTRNWKHGETYSVGSLEFAVLHCPGHTRGHVVFAEKKHRKVFVGDCLFAGSIGRTDLPGGNYEQLIESIETNLLSLDDETIVYSGHGSETTIGKERTTNPFLTGVYKPTRGRFV